MSFKKTADTLTKGAHTLERDFYTSSQILNNEYKKIFQSQWICVGRSEELTAVGQYKTINLGNESVIILKDCLLYTSPSPRDRQKSRMPSSA